MIRLAMGPIEPSAVAIFPMYMTIITTDTILKTALYHRDSKNEGIFEMIVSPI